MYVFGHGAGAGMRHPFMEAVAEGLAGRSVAALRYQFPCMEQGRKMPDRAPVLAATVRAAVAEARRVAPALPLLAGGKSMGRRMTSTAAGRGAHLSAVGLPMLFLQGSRDTLADLSLLRAVLGAVRPPPRLHVVEGADHGFHVLMRSGRTDVQVLQEICDRLAEWVGEVLAGG